MQSDAEKMMEWQRESNKARLASRAREEEHWRKEDAAVGQILAFCLVIVGLTMLGAALAPWFS